MNPCMVRIGGSGGHNETGRPFRPCLLPTNQGREIEGEFIPVCVFHRHVKGVVRFRLEDLRNPLLIAALEALAEARA